MFVCLETLYFWSHLSGVTFFLLTFSLIMWSTYDYYKTVCGRRWLHSPETEQQSEKERIECSMSRLVMCQLSQRLPTYPRPHTSLASSLCQGAHATALRLIPQNSACVSVCAWVTFRLLHCHLCWHHSVYHRGTVPVPSVADDSLYPLQYVGLVKSHIHTQTEAHMHTQCSD